MYTSIIHDKDRIPCRKWVHVVKEAINKLIEELRGIRLVQYIKMQNAVKGQCRKHGVSGESVVNSSPEKEHGVMDSPFPLDKVVTLSGLSPNWGPGTSSFCCVAITSSLINENKLFRQICFCYVDLVLSTNLFIPFKCWPSDLDEQMRRHNVNRAVLVVLTSL